VGGGLPGRQGQGKDFLYQTAPGKAPVFLPGGCEGAKLFSEGDIGLLAEKNAAALTRLFDVARKLNAIGAQDVEDLVGNSGAVQDGSSISPSPVS